MAPPGGGRHGKINEQYRVPPPKSVKEVPSYVYKVVTSLFKRLFYIYGLVWEARKSLLFIMMFMAFFNGVMPVAGAYISAALLNTLAKVVTGEITNFSAVTFLLLLQAGYLLLKSIVSQVYTMINRVSGEVVSNHIKEKIMNKSKTVDLGCYDLPDFYAKLENANREAGMRPVNILSSSFTVISTAISLVSFIIVLSAINWWSPLFIILCSAPSAVISFIYRRKTVNYMWWHSKERRQMNYYSDVLVNKDVVKEVRMYGIADSIIGRYRAVFKKYFKGIKKLIIGEGCWNIAATFVSAAVNCFLLVFIAKGVYDGRLLVGDYSLYAGALNTISGGVSTIISTVATIYEGTLFINNMISYMDQKQHIVPLVDPPAKVTRHIGHKVEFKNVSFRYPGTERYVIKNVDLTIGAGETVVIVGLNGAGKTTLIKLLTRLYDPTDGVILLDGRDIREYDTAELYKMFGIIFQDFGKYAMTVAENIELGEINREHKRAEVEYAAKQANATEYIGRLPVGFDTPLMRWFEDEGIEPSTGQWQKLAIARAFYSDSDFLILDEPTASLDPMAEQEIFNQFDSLRKDKTTIFVSHRLSSATTADKIVVLEYGQVLETGNHAELMASHGRYYELFSTQAKRYITPAEPDGKPAAEIRQC